MSPTATLDLTPSAESLLTHLRVEEIFLRAVRTSLAEVHDALHQGDRAAAEAARNRQQALADIVPGLQARRARVAAGVGSALGLPTGGVNLAGAADRLPKPWGEKLLAARGRLRALAEEVRGSLNRHAALPAPISGFVHQALTELAHGEQPPARRTRPGSASDGGLTPLVPAGAR